MYHQIVQSHTKGHLISKLLFDVIIFIQKTLALISEKSSDQNNKGTLYSKLGDIQHYYMLKNLI